MSPKKAILILFLLAAAIGTVFYLLYLKYSTFSDIQPGAIQKQASDDQESSKTIVDKRQEMLDVLDDNQNASSADEAVPVPAGREEILEALEEISEPAVKEDRASSTTSAVPTADDEERKRAEMLKTLELLNAQ